MHHCGKVLKGFVRETRRNCAGTLGVVLVLLRHRVCRYLQWQQVAPPCLGQLRPGRHGSTLASQLEQCGCSMNAPSTCLEFLAHDLVNLARVPCTRKLVDMSHRQGTGLQRSFLDFGTPTATTIVGNRARPSTRTSKATSRSSTFGEWQISVVFRFLSTRDAAGSHAGTFLSSHTWFHQHCGRPGPWPFRHTPLSSRCTCFRWNLPAKFPRIPSWCI